MLNMVMMMGRLTADPELMAAEGGKEYIKFSIAVQRPRTEKNPEPGTDYFSCIAWEGVARTISQWYAKGDLIMIQGVLRNNHYTDKNNIKHYSEQIMVKQVHFTGSKRKSENDSSELPDNDLSFSEEALAEFESMFP